MMVMVRKIDVLLLEYISTVFFYLIIDGIHTPVANALITDEHSTVTGK